MVQFNGMNMSSCFRISKNINMTLVKLLEKLQELKFTQLLALLKEANIPILLKKETLLQEFGILFLRMTSTSSTSFLWIQRVMISGISCMMVWH